MLRANIPIHARFLNSRSRIYCTEILLHPRVLLADQIEQSRKVTACSFLHQDHDASLNPKIEQLLLHLLQPLNPRTQLIPARYNLCILRQILCTLLTRLWRTESQLFDEPGLEVVHERVQEVVVDREGNVVDDALQKYKCQMPLERQRQKDSAGPKRTLYDTLKYARTSAMTSSSSSYSSAGLSLPRSSALTFLIPRRANPAKIAASSCSRSTAGGAGVAVGTAAWGATRAGWGVGIGAADFGAGAGAFATLANENPAAACAGDSVGVATGRGTVGNRFVVGVAPFHWNG